MTDTALRSDRLILRTPEARDARVMTRALNNINISRWLTVVPFPYGMTDAAWFISETIKGTFHAKFIWHDDRFIGTMGMDDGFGYWIAQEHWGKGYATEAGQAMLTHHFATTDDDTVTSSYFEGNDASCNVLTKLGFLDAGPENHFSKARNAPVPGRRMSLTRRSWDARQDG